MTLLALYWMLTLIGCWTCPEIQGNYFDIEGIRLKEYRHINNSLDLLSEGEEIDYKELYISLDFDVRFYGLYQLGSNPFLNSSYALSCGGDGDAGSREILKNITITTLNNFDANYLATDTINDLITTNVYSDKKSLTEFLKQDSLRVDYFSLGLLLNKKPVYSESTFKIVFELVNGEIYSGITKTLLIK